MTMDDTQRANVIARLMERGLSREDAEARLEEHLAKKAAPAAPAPVAPVKAAEATPAPVKTAETAPAAEATEPKRRGRPPKAKE